MRRTAEEMSDATLELVYIAGNLSDAQAAERELTRRGIDYILSLDQFKTTSLLGGEHTGLFFYVDVSRHGECVQVLEAAGLRDTVSPDF
jgi:hypothetical protein